LKTEINFKNLDKQQEANFHTFAMKGMFICKQGRQDILHTNMKGHTGAVMTLLGKESKK
jgi:hypothetical protein